MKLKLEQQFRSIEPFGDIELSSFTVLVGLNGTGKSQILEGIQTQHVSFDALSDQMPGALHPGVVRLTNASLNLNSDVFHAKSMQPANEMSQVNFKGHMLAVFKSHVNQFSHILGENASKLQSPLDIMTMTQHEIELVFGPGTDQYLLPNLTSMFDALNMAIVSNHMVNGSGACHAAIKRASEKLRIEPRLVTYENAHVFGSWGDYSLFDARLTKLFAGYRREANENLRKAPTEGRSAADDWLDAAAFQKACGTAPWEQLSDLLQTFALNYRVAPPGGREIDTVALYFESLDDEHTHVEFSELSAGEKVLVVLAASLLNIDPVRATIRKPALLLLDEIDASLHPAVLHQWMHTIQEKVVKQLGIPCIMTTHSPITVALAPDHSLFEMTRDQPALRKTSKRDALNKLTVGVPSMEVDFTLRRQVFVEAEVDAQAYDRLYNQVKAELKLPRSLNFLSTGIKAKDGQEQGTGCTAVKKVVDDLTGFGNLSTFGLLDWDGERTATKRIHVLASGSHYAFDNVILNPLLIGILLIRDGKLSDSHLPKFSSIGGLDNAGLQGIADAVQGKLTYPAGAPSGLMNTQFLGGAVTSTDIAFCTSNGHAMESALDTAFPSLKQHTRQRGKLALEVIGKVLGDFPSLCPSPLVTAFEALANTDP